jgi:hypothetical protein
LWKSNSRLSFIFTWIAVLSFLSSVVCTN